MMPYTKPFSETVRERARREPSFRRGLLQEAVQCYLSGEPEVGKVILRDYINASVGFRKLAEETHHSPKSLMRMLSPSGNPKSNNLFQIIQRLQEHEGIRFEIAALEGAEEPQEEDKEHEGADTPQPAAAGR